MAKWYKTSEQLPVIPEKDARGFSCNSVYVQAVYEEHYSKTVRPLVFTKHEYAKTEKGRMPRFEDVHGRIAQTPYKWAYLDSYEEAMGNG